MIQLIQSPLYSNICMLQQRLLYLPITIEIRATLHPRLLIIPPLRLFLYQSIAEIHEVVLDIGRCGQATLELLLGDWHILASDLLSDGELLFALFLRYRLVKEPEYVRTSHVSPALGGRFSLVVV